MKRKSRGQSRLEQSCERKSPLRAAAAAAAAADDDDCFVWRV
jgi:hypothetical protein